MGAKLGWLLLVLSWLVPRLDALAMPDPQPMIERVVASKFLPAPRTIRVVLPASYRSSPERRYPVVYFHDGQNVFSSAGDSACFGWGNWQADRTALTLAAAGKIEELILVGIDNSRDRYSEYRGPNEADLETSPPPPTPTNSFRRYSRFLIEELKPLIDREYRTLPDPRHTAVVGSSLGGICSLALAWEHSEIFGLAGVLSGAFQIDRTFFIRRVLTPYAGAPKPFQCYIDSGVVDYTGGDDGHTNMLRVVEQLRRIGWREGVDLHSVVDDQPRLPDQLRGTGLPESKWPEAKTNQHNEFYWRLRLGGVLERFFPRKS